MLPPLPRTWVLDAFLMGLANALVDRARCIRQTRTGVKVEGQPQLVPDLTVWFKCRIEAADTSARADDGHWQRVATTWLTCGKFDMARQPVRILATDYIQVVSADVDVGEDTIWQIDGDVMPMRRRSGIIGYECKINQVREAPTWLTSMPAI